MLASITGTTPLFIHFFIHSPIFFKMASTIPRRRELDFLRGLAIVLVLFRHQPLFTYTMNMGWIGVDLFFVLSGFLVSGLLFKELIKFGNIKPSTFLIRRGFKIYPLFYIALLVFTIGAIYEGRFSLPYFLSEMFFYQNYYKKVLDGHCMV